MAMSLKLSGLLLGSQLQVALGSDPQACHTSECSQGCLFNFNGICGGYSKDDCALWGARTTWCDNRDYTPPAAPPGPGTTGAPSGPHGLNCADDHEMGDPASPETRACSNGCLFSNGRCEGYSQAACGMWPDSMAKYCAPITGVASPPQEDEAKYGTTGAPPTQGAALTYADLNCVGHCSGGCLGLNGRCEAYSKEECDLWADHNQAKWCDSSVSGPGPIVVTTATPGTTPAPKTLDDCATDGCGQGCLFTNGICAGYDTESCALFSGTVYCPSAIIGYTAPPAITQGPYTTLGPIPIGPQSTMAPPDPALLNCNKDADDNVCSGGCMFVVTNLCAGYSSEQCGLFVGLAKWCAPVADHDPPTPVSSGTSAPKGGAADDIDHGRSCSDCPSDKQCFFGFNGVCGAYSQELCDRWGSETTYCGGGGGGGGSASGAASVSVGAGGRRRLSSTEIDCGALELDETIVLAFQQGLASAIYEAAPNAGSTTTVDNFKCTHDSKKGAVLTIDYTVKVPDGQQQALGTLANRMSADDNSAQGQDFMKDMLDSVNFMLGTRQVLPGNHSVGSYKFNLSDFERKGHATKTLTQSTSGQQQQQHSNSVSRTSNAQNAQVMNHSNGQYTFRGQPAFLNGAAGGAEQSGAVSNIVGGSLLGMVWSLVFLGLVA